MSSYAVRPLSYIDYHNEYFELLQQSFTIIPSEISINSFNEFVGSLGDNHQVFVIEKDNLIVGSITVLIEQKIIHSMGKVAHIEDLITHKSYRGQHIATTLIEEAKQYTKKNNCYKIILNCNEVLEPFYERNGFTKKEMQMVIYL